MERDWARWLHVAVYGGFGAVLGAVVSTAAGWGPVGFPLGALAGIGLAMIQHWSVDVDLAWRKFVPEKLLEAARIAALVRFGDVGVGLMQRAVWHHFTGKVDARCLAGLQAVAAELAEALIAAGREGRKLSEAEWERFTVGIDRALELDSTKGRRGAVVLANERSSEPQAPRS